ncbi:MULTISPECIES: sigma-70 family RNA polymerase sigma factor [unclassified Oceanobacter]|jgi:RNA polymerase sigma-70 factor (ECF subfamily)|uniref:sigma-70 family RNA polymerase sigma factor n=1 Tax=unclassified Oceanobacter TaxID=2620260 RepID=UPI0026E2B8E3|nr:MULTISPECIES: sigma-70 family RNA polymerase sigma factor [unclassified Oceanobacter]MDO6683394.1 sigma-70 family RNA polymerase sigma factor [Oceanobacter sp. 5_MG-2023]MDP2506868.1 sigma-70 family RNA polymerase sigma factor [Oceanobacter sp. 3_MG-2023]MDP2547803.1 sigma-70 family RNA polymerase sigma factor [Oceanobacter sp. 4_MG-2023]MDP2608421.1 sigma-70 family RNA polymerase sigma factor [Oceanobacter sp. 1_MG-2023]MDP2611516.1 sigma-70 family RNA polymerase sigma factor [Oceanobacter
MPVSLVAQKQFGALYKDHHPWLLLLLRRRLGCDDDAADLAQDAFIRLMNRPQTLEGNEARAYLTTVAKGLCVDLWRRRQVENAWQEAVAAWPENVTPSLEEQALVIEALCEVDTMLRQMPEKVARAFLLSRLEGLTYREIGQRLEVSERMVKKYMASAMYECALLEMNTMEAQP